MKRLPKKLPNYGKTPCLLLNMETNEIEVGFASCGNYWRYSRARGGNVLRVELKGTYMILADIGLILSERTQQSEMRQELNKKLNRLIDKRQGAML